MKTKRPHPPLCKAPTGIQGLDDITNGGLPRERATLVCGGPGCGKTLLCLEFLIRGATQFNEPGVLLTFEENTREIVANVASLGFDVPRLLADKKLFIDKVQTNLGEIADTGAFNLEGLFVRLDHAIKSIGARRVVIDTIESLFEGLPHPVLLRSELRRMLYWLKQKGVTTLITAERRDPPLMGSSLEDYVSDCVLLLDHRVNNLVATRHLRVVKYRGSTHGTNEYPFHISSKGICLLPITPVNPDQKISNERISTGLPRLDTMLGGKGYFRGSSILLSGTPGTGKTSIAAHLVNAACARGERCLFFALEEPPKQVIRYMLSIGLDLEQWQKKGLLLIQPSRPCLYGLETHLARLNEETLDFQPTIVVIDPITSFAVLGQSLEIKSMMTRLVDLLKPKGITIFLTTLIHGEGPPQYTGTEISSSIDTWIELRDVENQGERNRILVLAKSRGMAHSNQVREFRITDRGVELADVYLGAEGALTGSARMAQEQQKLASQQIERQRGKARERLLIRRRKALEAQIRVLQADFDASEAESLVDATNQQLLKSSLKKANLEIARGRWADREKAGASGKWL